MLTQHPAQGGVQQMGRGVIEPGALAHLGVYAGPQAVALADTAFQHLDMMQVLAGGPGGVRHLQPHTLAIEITTIPRLTTGFGVKRRTVQYHHPDLTHRQRRHFFTVAQQGRNRAAAGLAIIAGKGSAALQREHRAVVDPETAAFLGAHTLLRHGRVVTRHIQAEAALPGDIIGEVGGETVGVVQLEHQRTGYLVRYQARKRLFQDLHAVVQRLGKLFLFRQQGFFHLRLAFHQVRVGLTHLLGQGAHQAMEERCRGAQFIAVTDGAANNPAQYIASALVARHDAIDDEESAGADMVGDDLERAVLEVGHPEDIRGRCNQGLEQVDLVIAVHPLHHGGDSLKAHAGIHRGFWQGMQFAARVAVVLHEYQVPDLDIAVQVIAFAARGAAGHIRAVVVKKLGAGTAGAGVTHLPEVVFVQARQPGGVDPDLVDPDVRRLVVGDVDRHPESFRWQPEHFGEELPTKTNGLALEVIAKAEVAKHFEKCVVASGVADIFQIVVLATGAHAALAAGRAHVGTGVDAEEGVLELVHTGIGKEQCGVVGRHQRTAGHTGMAVLFKIGQEGLANLWRLHIRSRLQRCGRRVALITPQRRRRSVWHPVSRPCVLRRRFGPR